jgi:hypothetical protein
MQLDVLFASVVVVLAGLAIIGALTLVIVWEWCAIRRILHAQRYQPSHQDSGARRPGVGAGGAGIMGTTGRWLLGSWLVAALVMLSVDRRLPICSPPRGGLVADDLPLGGVAPLTRALSQEPPVPATSPVEQADVPLPKAIPAESSTTAPSTGCSLRRLRHGSAAAGSSALPTPIRDRGTLPVGGEPDLAATYATPLAQNPWQVLASLEQPTRNCPGRLVLAVDGEVSARVLM